MNTMQTTRQRELLQNIVADIGDIERIAFGPMEDYTERQQRLAQALGKVRRAAMAEINLAAATEILAGYKGDAIDGVVALRSMIASKIGAVEDRPGLLSDNDLQMVSLVAQSVVDRVEKYMRLRDDVVNADYLEVDHG